MQVQQRAFTAAASRPAYISRVPARKLSIFARESRIGGKPIPIPKGTQVTINGTSISLKGPRGELSSTFLPHVRIEQENEFIRVYKAEETRVGNQQHGLVRTLTNNMVVGVSEGFTKSLQLFGTGYRASATNTELTLNVGYSNPRVLAIPPGLSVKVERNIIRISGNDKATVGDFAATCRRQRPPEPYKGKGIRYEGEVIRMKEGKAGGKKK